LSAEEPRDRGWSFCDHAERTHDRNVLADSTEHTKDTKRKTSRATTLRPDRGARVRHLSQRAIVLQNPWYVGFVNEKISLTTSGFIFLDLYPQGCPTSVGQPWAALHNPFGVGIDKPALCMHPTTDRGSTRLDAAN